MPQDAPRCPQDAPRCPQDAPRRPPRHLKEAPKMPQDIPQDPPRCSKMPPKMPPRCLQDALRRKNRPSTKSKMAQDGPEGCLTVQRPPTKRKRGLAAVALAFQYIYLPNTSRQRRTSRASERHKCCCKHCWQWQSCCKHFWQWQCCCTHCWQRPKTRCFFDRLL